MHIPTALINLREPYSSLRHTAREQAVVGERAGLSCLVAVERPRTRWLIAHVGEFGDRRLHAERHLVFLDARVRLRIPEILVRELVNRVYAVDEFPAS